MDLGAATRSLGEVCAGMGKREEAHAAFAKSLEILGEIQSRPELAQTLLAYGRFLATQDPAPGNDHVEQALRLFREMDATGWIDEARAALV